MPRRRQFAGIAHDLASRFVSRNNDVGGAWGIGVLARSVHLSGRDSITLDLLAGEPRDGGSSAWLRNRLLATGYPASWLDSAQIGVLFRPVPREDLGDAQALWGVAPDVPLFTAEIEVTLVDDRGRTWRRASSTWCWEHRGPFDPRAR